MMKPIYNVKRVISTSFKRSSLMLAILLASAVLSGNSTPARALEKTDSVSPAKVRIGYSRLRISLPVFAAQELGLFKKYGVDAQLEMYDTGQSLGQALVEGKVDVGGYLAYPISFNGMLRTGKKFYFVTTMIEDKNHRVSYLLRRKPASGKKAEIRSIKDLRGKKVGILPTIAYKATIEAMLKKSGIDPAEVTIQQTDPALQPQLLANGGVDALYTIDPAATAAIASGTAELLDSDIGAPQIFGEPFPFGHAMISKEWATANPELTSRIVQAIDEAIVYINSHPKEANKFLKPYLPAVYHPHIPLYPNALYLTSADSKDEIITRVAKQYREIGIINKDIDLTGAIYHGKKIAPQTKKSKTRRQADGT